MEKKPLRPISPFDELVVPPSLQNLKLLLPYIPESSQETLGTFVKFLEFKETLSYFRKRHFYVHSQESRDSLPASPAEILEAIKPYLAPQDAAVIDTVTNMLQMMEMVKTFQEFSSSEASDDSTQQENSGFSGADFSPVDLLMNMLSPEQRELFETYNSMFSNTDNTDRNTSPESGDSKGDDTDERMDESPGDGEH